MNDVTGTPQLSKDQIEEKVRKENPQLDEEAIQTLIRKQFFGQDRVLKVRDLF